MKPYAHYFVYICLLFQKISLLGKAASLKAGVLFLPPPPPIPFSFNPFRRLSLRQQWPSEMFRVLRRMFCFQYSSPDIATASTEKKLGSLDHCSVRGVSNEALFGSKGVKETTSVDRIFKLNSHVTSLSHTLHKHSQENTSKQ